MKQTIQQIKERLNGEDLTTEEVELYRQDTRKGVQKAVVQYEKRVQEFVRLEEQFYEMKQFERKHQQSGYTYIAGIDEAGRGPLAGPVVAGAVILPDDFYLPGLNDSKQLSEAKREYYFDYINEHACATGVGVVSSKEIDEWNIYEATKVAMMRAIGELEVAPDMLLIDAMKLPEANLPYEAITKGDARSVSIAAASVIAKVTRDRYMKKLGEQYPDYQFEKNMGYGTKAHLEAIERVGTLQEHRHTFAPIKRTGAF
ncbi:ribonuclease HII [Pontibacillus halophilus JSM 076056 = DSM 19796]|uniref:Ribonuclease HII n=1 Tax=Pontibacillus halophilus JSM 076056 = DSM 19796 TaxID=1385510 RepID=A0A0A5GMH6_9BACI|nr:ribonuclease HII [Pontibacillus halophilus]KGX93184.1 ribonuclease HII [Pontibacillus halophilus JSM 076056 = DSM 19796]